MCFVLEAFHGSSLLNLNTFPTIRQLNTAGLHQFKRKRSICVSDSTENHTTGLLHSLTQWNKTVTINDILVLI